MCLHGIITPDIVNVVDLTGKRWESPIALPKEKLIQWAEGLDIPRGGQTVIYPGFLEEEIVYIPSFRKKALEIIKEYGEGKEAVKKLEEALPSVFESVDISRRRLFEEPIRAVVKLLRAVNFDFGYLYEEETSPGFHQFLLGLDDLFFEVAKKTYSKFKERGVKMVITTNPAITKMLGHVYPTFLKEFDIEVRHFLEVLDPLLDRLPEFKGEKEPVVVHDCHIHGRDIRVRGTADKLRRLLERAGGIPIEPKYNKENVHCCGAPIALIDPESTILLARNRLNELLEAVESSGARKIVLQCPSCFNALYTALKKFGPSDVEMLDIATYAARRFWGEVG